MRYNIIMKANLFFLFAALCSCLNTMSAKMDTVTLGNAFAAKRIKLEIKGVGGYQGRCIKMKIENTQPVKMIIIVEAGRRLDSKDSTEQDILIIKDTMVILSAHQEKTFNATGYCCQAHNRAPKPKSSFTIGNLATGPLYNLARYMNDTPLPSQVIQNAIWVISDNINPAIIKDDGSSAMQGLRKFISFEKKVKFTWYNISYKNVGDKVFSGIPDKITGIIDYHISAYSQVCLVIKGQSGNIVERFDLGKAIGSGDYACNLNWNIYKLPNQRYTLIIYQNDEEIKREFITLNETAF